MLSGPRSLDELRREIDRIDDAIHDLLMERTAVVEEVGQAKALMGGNNGASDPQFFRPGREANVLRRLVGRHSGPFPRSALVRIWREIMAGQLRVQTELTVAVHVPEQQRGCWDHARDQYGSAVHYQAMQRTHQVVAAVRNGAAQIGVLPLPQDGETEPWWPLLAAPGPQTPRIVSRLPFAAGSGDGALSIACLDPEPTAEDASHVIVETVDDVSHGALVNELTGRGLRPKRLVAAPGSRSAAARLVLCEVEGHVAADDPRLADTGRGRIVGLRSIGGYAVPLSRAAMDGNGGGA